MKDKDQGFKWAVVSLLSVITLNIAVITLRLGDLIKLLENM